MSSLGAQPHAVRLPPNPVWRSYAGGRVLRRFRGRDGTDDDHFPEDWLASTVHARNGANSQSPDEGISLLGEPLAGQDLASVLQRDPTFWFGSVHAARATTGVLWKLLDSSVRLQFQAHPNRHFARRYLDSDAGKTECWYILGVRSEEACVYLGFQRPPSRDQWANIIREQRIEDMHACFDRIPVRPGECYVVPAGIPHAIGAGVFLVELMEPADWAVRCETTNAGVVLDADACFMGLGLERCLDVFDFRAFTPEQVRSTFQQRPRAIVHQLGLTEEEIIGPDWHEFFRLHRFSVVSSAEWPGGELMLLIALCGAGQLHGDAHGVRVQAGETWLLPGRVRHWEWQANSEPCEFLVAKLPITRTG